MTKRLTFIFVLSLLPLFALSTFAQDESPDDPGHKANGTLGVIKYSIPKGFDLENPSNGKTAFFRSKNDLAIFVNASSTRPDNKALNDLASEVAVRYLPKEQEFKWKPTGVDQEPASKFEISGGSAKGLSKGKKLVQLYYKVIGIKGRYVTLGYIMEFGEQTPAQADYSFTLDGTLGTSDSTWHAIAHIIASITAEPFQDIDDKLP